MIRTLLTSIDCGPSACAVFSKEIPHVHSEIASLLLYTMGITIELDLSTSSLVKFPLCNNNLYLPFLCLQFVQFWPCIELKVT